MKRRNNMDTEVVIEGLDIVDVTRFIIKKRNKFLAIALADLEKIVSKESNEYKLIRKVFLDQFNDYTRSILRTLFGDVEGLIMK
jgi:hypothetical protein